MKMDTQMSKEQLSALLDGELDPRDIDALLAALQADESLLDEGRAWQVTSDVLRDESPNLVYMTRFSEALAAEPVILAPGRIRRHALPLRWVAASLAMTASVAFVGVALWQINHPAEAESQMALETDSPMYAYLVAHRESDGDPFIESAPLRSNVQPVEYRR